MLNITKDEPKLKSISNKPNKILKTGEYKATFIKYTQGTSKVYDNKEIERLHFIFRLEDIGDEILVCRTTTATLKRGAVLLQLLYQLRTLPITYNVLLKMTAEDVEKYLNKKIGNTYKLTIEPAKNGLYNNIICIDKWSLEDEESWQNRQINY